MGRPKSLEVTPETIKHVEQLAAQGLTKEQIARTLGVCYNTLNERQKEYPEFLEAIKNGQSKGIAKVSNKLFQKALEGDNTAMIFYLKNRDPDNWEDVQKRTIDATNTHRYVVSDSPSQSEQEWLAKQPK